MSKPLIENSISPEISYCQNSFRPKEEFVVYSNDDFFEMEIFEKEVYEVGSNSPSQEKGEFNSLSTRPSPCMKQIEGECLDVEDIFGMNDEDLVQFCSPSVEVVRSEKEKYLSDKCNSPKKNEKESEEKIAPKKPMESSKNNEVLEVYVKSEERIISENETENKREEKATVIPNFFGISSLFSTIEANPESKLREIEGNDKNSQNHTHNLVISKTSSNHKSTADNTPQNESSNRHVNHFSSQKNSNKLEDEFVSLSFKGPSHQVNNSLHKASFAKQRSESCCISNSAGKKGSFKYFDEYPSVGVGIVVIYNEKLLLGRRIDSGMYGLPGGWIEYAEEWEECASRELLEETGIDVPASEFKHVYTINSISLEKNYHAASCVMFVEIDESKVKTLHNKEPNKCYGWFWISLTEMKSMNNLLFHPLRQFLGKNPQLKKASDFKGFLKNQGNQLINIDELFELEM